MAERMVVLFRQRKRALGQNAASLHVAVQGEPRLENVDVMKEAGGRLRTLAKEIKGVTVSKTLTISFKPTGKDKAAVLCGVEIIQENSP